MSPAYTLGMSKVATPDHPIHELVARRWSPYAFSSQPIGRQDLQSIFEAARWAPSSFNEQPWRYVVATQARADEFGRILDCLLEGNRLWARSAPVLALGCTRRVFTRGGKPNRVALHDLGLASAFLTLEATSRGIFVHQMAGIMPERAREVFCVPNEYEVVTGLALGYRAEGTGHADHWHERDSVVRNRRALAEFVFSGDWGQQGL